MMASSHGYRDHTRRYNNPEQHDVKQFIGQHSATEQRKKYEQRRQCDAMHDTHSRDDYRAAVKNRLQVSVP